MVLCTAGRITVTDGVGPVILGPGRAAVGPAVGGSLTVTGEGETYIASTGLV
ncbi:hypothetical protein GCM10029963_36470 [Micromonospora andamanensis]